jgi:hypothetical protein
MGSVKYDILGDEVRKFVNATEAFSISDSHFIEEVINIEKGAIESIIIKTEAWIIDLIEECRKKNLIAI